MQRLTLKEAKRIISRVTKNGECEDSQYLTDLVNEAQDKLIKKGKFARTLVDITMCMYSGHLILPRELVAAIRVNKCAHPIQIRNQWFEFLDTVGTQQTGDSSRNTLIDQGTTVLFRELCSAQNLRVYPDLQETSGSRILIKGLDENFNRVMTLDGDKWIDGEYIDLSTGSFVDSVHSFTSIDSVIKPRTSGFVRLYQVDPSTSVQSLIGLYAPSEELPIYRKYKIPTIKIDPDNPTIVRVLAKRGHVPVYEDNDELVITNISALKKMVQAIENYDVEALEPAVGFERTSKNDLEEELNTYNGGSVPGLNIQSKAYGMGNVRNRI